VAGAASRPGGDVTARGTGVLLAVLAALAAWLWLVELAPRPTPPPAPGLLAVPATTVTRVELDGDGRHLVARRRGHAWMDETGRPWRPATVDAFLEALRTLPPIMVVDAAPRHPADYGLDAPTRLRVMADGGRPVLDLELGAPNPAGTNRYARRAGEPAVILVGAVLDWELRKLRDAAP
jgi:hypothetical protein